VRGLGGVAPLWDAWRLTRGGGLDPYGTTDPQSKLETDMSESDMNNFHRELFCERVSGISSYSSAQMRGEHAQLQVDTTRSEDGRSGVLGALFTRVIKGVGPKRDGGEPAVCCVMKGGKTNKAGRSLYAGHLPHLNPLRDADTAIFTTLLYRWMVSGPFHPTSQPHKHTHERTNLTSPSLTLPPRSSMSGSRTSP